METSDQLEKERADDEQKETLKELRASRYFYRTLIEKTLDCIALVDEKGCFTFLSPSVERVLGYQPDELIGQNAFDYFHPEEMLQLSAMFFAGMKKPGNVASFEQRFRHKDGAWRVIEVTGTNLIHDPLLNGGLISFRDISQRKQAEDQIKRINQEMKLEAKQRKIISKRLTQLMEQDRRSVALDLHDHIGQMLTTLKMSLSSALEKMTDPYDQMTLNLKSASRNINQIMDSLRNIARGLLPSELDALGLTSSLRSLCLQIQELSGVSVKFFTKNINERFDPEKELALYRVAQEALNNVVKHAGAGEVHVSLTRRDSIITLAVEDDGAGFVADKVQNYNNLGLLYMQERLFQIKGELRIESSPGEGTVIWAEVPV